MINVCYGDVMFHHIKPHCYPENYDLSTTFWGYHCTLDYAKLWVLTKKNQRFEECKNESK